jgi:hypothetical protein
LTLTFKMARNSSFSNATMTFVIAPIIFNKHFQHYWSFISTYLTPTFLQPCPHRVVVQWARE